MPPSILQKMGPVIPILIVVGHVHCSLTYNDVSRALGYKSDGATLHYTPNEVQVAYEDLSGFSGRRPKATYSLWGPHWRSASSKDRITQQQLDWKKTLVREGLRRAEYVRTRMAVKAKEQSYRKTQWKRIRGLKSDGD